MTKVKEKRTELFNKQHTQKWPEDGTDWDGISNDTLEQILQDHEDAKKWNHVKDIGPSGGYELLASASKDRQIVKRLEETIIEVSKGSIESLMLKEYNYDVSQEVMEILQKILEGGK